MYVLMISPNNFPNGDAGAVRDEYFAKIYQELGYDIIHFGMNDIQKKGIYKNVEFMSLYKNNKSIIYKLMNIITYPIRLNNLYIKMRNDYGTPAVIHIYDIPKKCINWAISLAEKLDIPIVHDSVEWYSPCEFTFGRLAYPYVLKNRTNTKLIREPISVIAISTFLERHFSKRGLDTIRIPVIMDSSEYETTKTTYKDKIKIVYAGSPAKKDYLAECIYAFAILPIEKKQRLEFHIFGADLNYVQFCCNNESLSTECIFAHGRVQRYEVMKKLAESDFSLLLRPEKERYSQAGFPTKSVEAMMSGCAMICNLTSDLNLYLENDVNAIIVNDCSREAMRDALVKVAELNHETIDEIKNNARDTAEKYFDYRHYIDDVANLIKRKQEND